MAVNLSKIYTKSGDKGFTRLVGGAKITKADIRLECYGTVDELNSLIGVIRTLADASELQNSLIAAESIPVLAQIQNELFDIGSILATPPDSEYMKGKSIDDSQIEALESKIDEFLGPLESLKSFTLPGGSPLNAHSHVARTVCRRLERLLWQHYDELKIDDQILKYINRLSDFLFVYSRWVIHQEGKEEFLWVPGKK